MEFDVHPIPSATENSAFTSRYMEAKVMEDFKLLNEITENYSLGYLTESCAIAMLDILDNDEYKLLETAMEAADALDHMTLEDALEVPGLHTMGFVGEGVLPYKEIIKANDGESIFNPYTFERTWGDDSLVGKMSTRIADEKEQNLKIYKESEGKDGFTAYERSLYTVYPDDRIDPDFLYESAVDGKVLSGAISLEDGFMLKDFINSRFAVKEEVAAMMPVVPLNGIGPDPDLTNTNIKDMVAATNSEAADNDDNPTDPTDDNDDETIYGVIHTESAMDSISSQLRSYGAFIALEGVIYKNNIVFDSEAKKIFDKIYNDLKLTKPDDPNASFKHLLNIKKDRYTFNFANMEADQNQVAAAIISVGFKPIKENGIVVRYEKVAKGIKITVEFTSIDNGILIYYVNNDTVVKESSLDEKLDFGLNCDASDVKDAAKKVKKLKGDKDTSKEDLDEAINNLDHAIENYKEVQKEKENPVKESASNSLTKMREIHVNHLLVNDWMRESASDMLESSHPLFCKDREFVHNSLNESMDGMKKILMTEHAEDFVSERKEILCKEFDLSEHKVIESFEYALMEAPNKKVFESCYEVLERIFDEDVNNDSFKESVEVFKTVLLNQADEEEICETVLNGVEFSMEVMVTESEDHDIDEDIKSTISVLNRLGYSVKYSCSGHNKTRIKEDNYRDGVYHGKMYTTARITFDKKYNFKSIPDGWYENKNSDKTSIYVRAFSYDPKDGTPNEAFEKWKASYMKALKDWVDNLDKADDNNDEAKTESVMESFFNEFMGDLTVPELVVEEGVSLDFDELAASLESEFLA